MKGKTTGIEAVKLLAPYLVIAISALAVYGGTFHYPFQFDDEPLFVNDDPGKVLGSVASIWEFNASRFIHFFSLAVNYWIGGKDTFGYHVVNTGIHVANGWLVFILARYFSKSLRKLDKTGEDSLFAKPEWLFPFAVALVFTLHPMQTEAVTYIWQRSTSLAATFYLLSLTLYFRHAIHGGRWPLALSLTAAAAAMFTKQSAVTIPVAIILADLCFISGSVAALKEKAGRLTLYFALVPVIPAMTALGLSRETTDVVTRRPNVASHLEYLLTQFNVIADYIRLLFWPTGQNLDYHIPIVSDFGGSAVSFAFLVLLVAIAVIAFRRNRFLTFGILFFFLALSVESSIFPLEDLMFEHRVYLPAAGIITAFFGTLFYLMEKLPAGRNARLAAVCAIAAIVSIALGAATAKRNEIWKDQKTLWSDVVKKSPAKARGYIHLAFTSLEKGDFDEAEKLVKKAIELKKPFSYAHYKLGRIYERKGDDAKAAEQFDIAFDEDNLVVIAANAAGDVYLRRGDCAKSLQRYIASVNAAPHIAESRVKLGHGLLACGKVNDALKVLRAVLLMEPGNPAANYWMGGALQSAGKNGEALAYFSKAEQLGFKPGKEEKKSTGSEQDK